jgi:hypothetical protein
MNYGSEGWLGLSPKDRSAHDTMRGLAIRIPQRVYCGRRDNRAVAVVFIAKE